MCSRPHLSPTTQYVGNSWTRSGTMRRTTARRFHSRRCTTSKEVSTSTVQRGQSFGSISCRSHCLTRKSPALGGLFASIRLAWNEQRYHHSVLHGRELVFQWRHFAPHQFRSHSWGRSWRCCRFACARRARSLAASMSPISREIDLPEPVPFKPSIPYSLIVPPEKRRRGSHGGVPPLPSMDSSVAVRTAPLPNHATAPPTTSDPLGSRLDELLNLRSDIQDLRRIVLGAHVAGPEPSDLGAPPSYS